jgi:SAM-dependent methyltransferase
MRNTRGVNITSNDTSVPGLKQKASQMEFYNTRFSEIDRALVRLVEPNLSYDKRLIEKVSDSIQNNQDSVILEICAGQGVEGILLSDTAGLIVCTDISHEALVVAREISKRYKKNNIELIQCDAEFLPFRDNVFDLSFGKDALHHVKEPVSVLQELTRCSKIGTEIAAIEANPLNPQMALIGLIYYEIDKGVFKNKERKLLEYFTSSNLKNTSIDYAEFLPRSILFYVSSPLLMVMKRYPSLNKIISRINIAEQKLEKMKYVQKFSNFLIIRGIKTGQISYNNE